MALDRFCRSVLLGLLLFTSAGCERLFEKSTKANLEAAAKKATAGEWREAILLYESTLDGTARTADAHYRIGLIYADKLKSPLDALHHFRRYLELAPKGTHAKEAGDYQKEGTRLLLAEVAKESPLTQEEAVRLRNENLSLRNLLNTLRAQKAAPPPTTLAGGKKGEEAQKPIPAGARTHVVKPGETLASIATKYYKNKARYREIQDANFYATSGTPKIKPGMTLQIP